MTAITDANTFIDQNLINVPYQGVPAITLNACLKTITNVFNSYATIASVNSLFGYALDGNFPAALMNAPNQAFTLNGGYVSISALLLFSSGQKYTVGPDGNYILNSVNSPAWDWSTGRRRLLIEAIGATNYWGYSEDATQWGGDGYTASVAANALYGTLALATITQSVSNSATLASTGVAACVNGDVMTLTVALLGVGSKTDASPAIYGNVSGWGSNSDTTCQILSGPGSLTQHVGGLWNVSGLSTTVPTLVRVTRTIRTTEGAQPIIYMTTGGSGNAGDKIKIGRPQFEKGYGSSYIVTPTISSVTRAADVVTAASGLLALLTAANATFAMRYTDPNAPNGAGLIGSTSGPAMVLDWDANTGAVLDNAAANVLSIPGATATNNRGLAVSYTAGSIKATLNGASAVNVAGKTLFSASDSGIQLCKPYASIYGGNFAIDEMIVWPIYASDAGLQAQARVYS